MKYYVIILITFLITSALGIVAYLYIQNKHQSDTDKLNQQISTLNDQLSAQTALNNEKSNVLLYTDPSNVFRFSYPKNLVQTSDSTKDAIVFAISADAKWSIQVSRYSNTDAKTAKQIAQKEAESLIKSANDAGNNASATYSDVAVDGITATKYVVNNYGDTGGTGIVFVKGNNYYTISGNDDSDLNIIADTFSFIK